MRVKYYFTIYHYNLEGLKSDGFVVDVSKIRSIILQPIQTIYPNATLEYEEIEQRTVPSKQKGLKYGEYGWTVSLNLHFSTLEEYHRIFAFLEAVISLFAYHAIECRISTPQAYLLEE